MTDQTNVVPFAPRDSYSDLIPGTNFIGIGIEWFNPGAGMLPIGILLVEDATMHYVKAYMGSGTDIKQIAQWGAKIPKEMAESIFGPLPDWKC